MVRLLKRYIQKSKCESNRENGWVVINGLGWQGVRMVAIDEDW